MTTTAPVPVSGATTFGPGCNGATQPGTLFPKAEVEPFVATNPANTSNLVAVLQQDRWSNGGSQALLAAYSTNGGQSWTPSASPPFSRCNGGNAGNGGDYERASDPWVTFGPDGSAYFMALNLNASDEDPNLLKRRAIVVGEDGRKHFAPTVRFRDEPSQPLYREPLLGEHTADILGRR